MKRTGMSSRSAPMRLCGPRWATEAEAKRSKAMLVPGAELVKGCPCKGVHVRGPRTVPVLPQRRATGFSARVKLLVRVRAGSGEITDACCESCGRWLGRYGGQIQHRHARKAGGSRDPVTGGLANAALLCGTPDTLCHGACEKRSPLMKERGWWIGTGNGPEHDPRYVRVVLWSGAEKWLGEDGKYLDAPPEASAA